MKWIAYASAIGLASAALASCGRDAQSDATGPVISELGPVHVHGLGINPADDSLFIATHSGMYRVPEGEDEATRVGDNYQDTMGFTIVGPDRFLGSGHPDLRQDLPPYLGLIESDAAGEAWGPVSLLGKADFHVLEAAGRRVYGFGSDFETREEQFLTSRDGGRSWKEITAPESVASLAIDPADSDHILASGLETVFESTDAGESWRSVSGEPGLLSWASVGELYSMNRNGSVSTTESADGPWVAVGGVGEEPAAFEAAPSGRLYAALHDGLIVESSDGGVSWALRSVP